MRPETAGCIADALLAAGRITECLAEVDQDQYAVDWKLQSIVERQFLILGEAAIRVRDLDPPVFSQLAEGDSIIRFRNLLVHVYNQIDARRVFEIAQEELPGLIVVLEALVDQARKQGL